VPVHRTFLFGGPACRISLIWLVGDGGFDAGNGHGRATDAGNPGSPSLSKDLEGRQDQAATTQLLPGLLATTRLKREPCGEAWQGSTVGGFKDKVTKQARCNL
jgi:hypothetical protein